jgi:hypothetical protein
MAPLAALHLALALGEGVDVTKTKVPMTVRSICTRSELALLRRISARRAEVLRYSTASWSFGMGEVWATGLGRRDRIARCDGLGLCLL